MLTTVTVIYWHSDFGVNTKTVFFAFEFTKVNRAVTTVRPLDGFGESDEIGVLCSLGTRRNKTALLIRFRLSSCYSNQTEIPSPSHYRPSSVAGDQASSQYLVV